MRPEKHRQHARSAAIARGRMFLKARMGWLPGFPIRQGAGTVEWMSVPRHGERTPTRIQLARDYLQRATYTWNKLVHRFPRVLPHLVDDRDAWTKGVPQVLDRLKGAIHRGEPVPGSLLEVEGVFSRSAVETAAALARRHPAWQPLLDALSWSTFLSPKELPRILAWLDENARAVTVLLEARSGTEGIVTVLTLWELARRDGSRRVEPLLTFMGDPRSYVLTTREAATYVGYWVAALRRNYLGTGRERRRAEPRMGTELRSFVFELLSRRRSQRRRALDLFALLLPGDLLLQWERWWAEVDPLLKRARRLVASHLNEPEREEDEHLALRLEALLKQVPPHVHLKRLLNNVREAAALDGAHLHRQICLTLKHLPRGRDRALVRAAFLSHWLVIERRYPKKVGPFLRVFRAFLAKHRHLPGLLTPWTDVVLSWNRQEPRSCWGLTEVLLDDLKDRRRWSMALDTIAACCEAGDDTLTFTDGERIAMLVKITGDIEEAKTCFYSLIDADLRSDHIDINLLRCARVLDAGRGRFGTLAAALHQVAGEDDHFAETVTTLAKHLHRAGWESLTADLILDGVLNEVHAVGLRFTVLSAVHGKIELPGLPLDPEAPGWSGRYPEVLRPTLALLASVAPNAEAIATRVLARAFPDPEAMRQELAVLEKLLAEQPDNANLARRRHNLHARLSSPRPVSPKRQAKLCEKLERATRRAVFQAWTEHLDHKLHVWLRLLLDGDEVPAWMYEPRQLRVLASLFQLSRPSRDLGIRLLRRRCGPPPWNLYEDPANQAFLARLRDRGVNTDPWMHPPEPRVWTGQNERQVRLVFEEDPLEIFQMGEHFKTCLSPGSVNFFSVFANAADVNKRVVYARDEQGRVVGRCLLALSESGGVLTFEPYCHDRSLGFDKMMGQLAEDLAARMETVVISQGKVSCLVASEWYDDGSRDLCNRFAFLQPDSPFRTSLATRSSTDFVSVLEALFDPLPLNALTLTLVLELPELRKRPDLILPLLPSIEACKDLADGTWLRAAHLAHHAGTSGFARRVLRRRAVPHMLALHRRHRWLDPTTMALLVELEPSSALQVLRRTRARGVRTDEDEIARERREYLACAHEALGRPIRAQRLRERRK
ncbi:MAG: hypothetical protein ACE5G0_11295 [Rhodothermales bacterium]